MRRALARVARAAVVVLALMARSSGAEPGEVRVRSSDYRPGGSTFSAQARLVELRVTVRDRRDEPVGGFRASDFELFDNVQRQQITVFSEERRLGAGAVSTAAAEKDGAPVTAPAASAAANRSIALFFDDTHTRSVELQGAKVAAERLIQTGLGASDRVAIFTDSGAVTVDFTNDTKVLLAALERLKRHTMGAQADVAICVTSPALTPYQAYAISHHVDPELIEKAVAEAVACNCPQADAGCRASQAGHVQDVADQGWDQFKHQSESAMNMLDVAVRLLASAPGSRVLVLISPGFVSGGMEQQREAILNAAINAHIVINSLNATGLMTGSRRMVEDQVLAELMLTAAEATGGRLIQNDNDLTGGLQKLASGPEVSYVIGFSPSAKADDKYHALKVKLTSGGGYHIESREGYYAESAKAEGESVRQSIDRAVLSQDTMGEFPATVRVSLESAKQGRVPIHIEINVDAKGLKFTKQGDRHVEQLTFVTVLEDASGNYLAGKQAVMDMALSSKTLADVQAKGIHAGLSFGAPKGSYQVREVIREETQGRMAASNTPVEVR